MRVPDARGRLAAALMALFTRAPAAPPSEVAESTPLVREDGLDAPTGAAAKLAALDARLQKLGGDRERLQGELAGREDDRLAEGRRARRLAREILLAELHGRTVASSPAALMQNATMRSGLRRVAARTLATHDARAKAVEDTKGALAALDLEEVRIRGERAVAESELRLEQEEERRRRETFRQIFEAEPGDVRSYGGHARVRVAEAGADDDEAGEEGFRGRKGKLPLPMQRRCRIKARKGDEYGGAYLTFTAPKETNVRAVGVGTVVFADELPPYGKLVVLDHGSGYFSVYGGLSRIGTGAGASVRENQVLGGVDAESPLVFQLREGARVVPPSPWFVQRRRSAPRDEPAP